jgi:hypothetical protein
MPTFINNCVICGEETDQVFLVHYEGVTVIMPKPGRYEPGSTKHVPVCLNHRVELINGASFLINNQKEENNMEWNSFIVLDNCPDWPLVGGLNRTSNWTGAEIEFFAPEEYDAAQHVHFYMSKDKADQIWSEVETKINEYDGLLSVSFEDNNKENNVSTERILVTEDRPESLSEALRQQREQPELYNVEICGAPTKKGTPCKVPNCGIKTHIEWHVEQAEIAQEERDQAFIERNVIKPTIKCGNKKCQDGNYHYTVAEVKKCYGVIHKPTAYADHLEAAHFGGTPKPNPYKAI